MGWVDKLKAKFPSNAKAAQALRRAWLQAAPEGAQQVSDNSLATKLGELIKGEVDWWQRRTGLTQLLADMVEVEPRVLLGGPRTSIGALPFPELPVLPPLQATEEPLPLFHDGWLLQVAWPTDGETHRWIFAPAGFGKSLALRYMELRHPDEVLAVRAPTLEAAVSNVRSDGRLVVIEIERRGSLDRDALAALRPRVPRAAVLAPHPLDEATNEPWGTGLERRRNPDGWTVAHPALRPRWRKMFLRWVEERLTSAPGDTKLSADELLEWLDEHDAHHVLVPSPGDLLALVRVFHAYPASSLSLADVARRWTRTLGASSGWQDGGARLWARHCAPRAFRKLVRRQLRQSHFPMQHLPPSLWERLVPRATVPAPDRDGPGARLAVGYLREGGVLRGHGGELALFPRFAAVGEAITHVTWLLRGGKVRVWGAMAVDRERQSIVDLALRTLPPGELLEVIRSVVASAREESSAALAGAIEAGFHAAAQRFTEEGFELPAADVPAWQQLAELQAQHLVEDAGWEGTARPLTRGQHGDRDTWLADAWLFSLQVPAPDLRLPTAREWDFPGWAKELRLTNLPSTRLFPWSTIPPHGGEPTVSTAIETIAILALTLVPRCADTSLPKELPRLLVPAAILAAPAHDWPLGPEHVSVLRYSWEERWLVDVLRSVDASQRDPCLARLWHAAVACAPAEDTLEGALIQLLSTHKILAPFLLEAVPLEALRSTLVERGWTNDSVHSRIDLLPVVPPPHRKEIYRHWLKDSGSDRMSKWYRARQMLERVPEEDFDELFEVFSPADPETTGEFARVLWRRDPQRALREAQLALGAAALTAAGWLWGCPREHLPVVAELAAKLAPVPDWLVRWARDRLTQAGPAADILYGILRRSESGEAQHR